MSGQGGGGGALHAAATSGDSSRVRQLLSAPAPRAAFPLRFTGWGSGRAAASTRPNVNELDAAGCTPLQRAAADGHEEIVRLLLANGADVNRRDALHGNTALHEAAWKGYSRTVALLATAGAQLGLPNNGGFASLHLCCQNGHNQSCRELLLAGCDPDFQNNYGDTALHTSARYGHAGVTRILISAQCRVSEQNKNGDTALHIAAAMGRRKLTRILLEAGCDRSLRNKQNETAKDIATRKDLNEIINIINSTRPKRRDKSNDRNKSKTDKGEKKKKAAPKVKFDPKSVPWSPYGCHYFPDPTSFPKPKLDTLPNEPLKKGEQYYLDLAGNICKGPVGVGYTCYCAPFFKHMEERLDRDKQELKAHIDKAHEKLDHKVTDLELKTQGQISELTRCVAAERVLCDKRHQHLEQWLLRGKTGRQSERTRRQDYVPLDSVMPRSKSLELLDDFDVPNRIDIEEGTKHNSKSMELLDDDCGQANKITTSKSTGHILDKLKPQKSDSNRRLLPLFNFKSQALRESANVNWLFQQNEAKSMKPNVHVVTVDHHADDDFEPRKTVSEIVAQLQQKNIKVENKIAKNADISVQNASVDVKQNGDGADNSESSDDEDNPIRSKIRPGIMRNSNLEMPNYENVNPTQSSDYETHRGHQEVAGSLYYQDGNLIDNPYFQTDLNFNSARTRNGVYSPTTVPEPNPLDYDAGNHIHVHPTESYRDINDTGLYVLDGRSSGYGSPLKPSQFDEQSGNRGGTRNVSRQRIGYVKSDIDAVSNHVGRLNNNSYRVDEAHFANGMSRQDIDYSARLKQDGFDRSNVGEGYRCADENKYYIDPLEIDTGPTEYNLSKETLRYADPLEKDSRQNDGLNFVNTNLQVNTLYNIKYDMPADGRSKMERRQIDLHLLERDVHNRIVNLHILDRDKKKDVNMMEHNDSGYSTKVYGSSQGNSPSLSGQLEVDTAVGNKNGLKANDVSASSLV